MKALKWAGIAVLVMIVLCTLAILFAPPARYETRVEIDRPVDVVWAVFTDEDKTLEWLEGLKSIEPISGEPMTAGSRFRLVFEENGEEVVMEEEMIAVVPEKEFSFNLSHVFMDAETKIFFEDLGGRTAVRSENVVHGKGLFKVLAPLMKSEFVERGQRQYENLKRVIESEPAAPPMTAEPDMTGDDTPSGT